MKTTGLHHPSQGEIGNTQPGIMEKSPGLEPGWCGLWSWHSTYHEVVWPWADLFSPSLSPPLVHLLLPPMMEGVLSSLLFLPFLYEMCEWACWSSFSRCSENCPSSPETTSLTVELLCSYPTTSLRPPAQPFEAGQVFGAILKEIILIVFLPAVGSRLEPSWSQW